MKEIKNNLQQERQRYVPAEVKVTDVTMHRAILSASNPNSLEKYGNENW